MTVKNRWRLAMVLGNGANIFLPLFPVAWIISGFGTWKLPKWLFPLWVTMDDSRLDKERSNGLAADYDIYLSGFKIKPLGVLLWHISRNRVWNVWSLFPVPDQHKYNEKGQPIMNQDIIVTEMIDDNLYRFNINGEKIKVRQDGRWAAGAGLKFVGTPDQYPDRYQINRGDTIAKETSIFGSGEMHYRIGSWHGWRKTSCEIVKVWWLFGALRWRTIYFGFNANRPSFKYKHQKLAPMGTWTV
jgi:hypothetical protein